MAARVRIGDVIEVPTSRGLAYVQHVCNNEKYGALVRILPGFYADRPAELSDVVKTLERFVTFFPLQAAISRGIFQIVGNEDLPPASKRFPLFRAAGFVDRAGRVHDWFLWDGEREWKVGQLTDEQRALPIRSVWNDTLLVQRIEEEWTPASDPRSQRS